MPTRDSAKKVRVAATVDASDPLPCSRVFLRAECMAGDKRTLIYWQGEFLWWSAGAWRPVSTDEISAAMYRFLERAGEQPSKRMVSNVLDALKASAIVAYTVRPPRWLGDSNQTVEHLVALRNGILDLMTLELSPLTPDFFVLSALPVEYDADADEPWEWIGFLESIWPNDAENIATLQELAGYLLTPDTSQQKIFLLVGPRRAGKGVILRTLAAMLGADNICAPTLSSLAGDFGLQSLIGKLAAFIGDARLGGRADQAIITERLLSISGQDNVSVARKFMTDYTARLDARFVLSTNELPRLTDSSGALASRFVLLVLSQSFYGREDLTLQARLTAELPGILNWAIAGRNRLLERGRFVQPSAGQAAVDQLHDLGSPIGAFVRAECQVAPGLSVGVDRLYDAWTAWCEGQGRARAGSKQLFGRDLSAACPGVRVAQRRDGEYRYRVYEGIDLGTR
jgi:putative DNA primase/helicase